MEFNQVKNLCKYAGPGVLCPDNYKHCNADNCPLTINGFIDDEECDRYCPNILQYRALYKNANEERKRLENAYRERAEQFAQLETELKTAIDASMDFLTSSLFDLKDKLNTTLKRLEP